MNRIHRVVFNQSLNSWQAVSETARGRTCSSSTARAARLLGAAAFGLVALSVQAADGGVGGNPYPNGQPGNPAYQLHAGSGGATGQGGLGGINDSDFASRGGNGGSSGPAGPAAGEDGQATWPGSSVGTGGAAGVGAGGAGGAGQGTGVYYGGGGGGGAAGAANLATNAAAVAGGAGGVGGNGDLPGAGGGGGAGGYGAVQTSTAITNTGSITGGAGGAGGNSAAQGGGGGGGGTALYLNAGGTSTNSGTVTGGIGGNGGNGGTWSNGPSGGGGGGGGNGVELSSGGLRNELSGTITGGNGGNGGSNGTGTDNGGGTGATTSGVAGNGGTGGDGVNAAGTGLQIYNAGSITGGNGGSAGTVQSATPAGIAGTGGAGGVGVRLTGDGNTLVNAGTIAGGTGLGGQANAVTITGNNNVLELNTGYSFGGAVVATGTGNALRLGGTTDASFNVTGIGGQYQGFSGYSKVNTSTWTLTGTTTEVTPWTVSGGTLSIASDASLGANSGALTLNGGTLQTTADITTSRGVGMGASGGTFNPNAGTTLSVNGVVSGAGSLTMAGAGTLALNNANAYTGGTALNSGTLAINNNQALGTGTFTINGGTVVSNVNSLSNSVAANADFNVSGFLGLAGPVQLNNNVRVTTVATPGSVNGSVNINGVISGSGGITYDSTLPTYDAAFSSGSGIGQFSLTSSASNTYTGPTAVQGNAWLVLQSAGVSVPTDLTISGNAIVATVASEQIADTARVTVNSHGQSVSTASGGAPTALEGLTLASWATGTPITETIGSLYGNGSVGLGSGTLRVGAGEFSGVVSDGSYSTYLASQPGGPAVAGKLVKYGPGTLVLSGDNTYTGGTTIDAGTLQLGAGGTTGSVTGDVANNGTLAFNRSNAYGFAGAISGSGTVQQLGSGTTTLTGINTYTGGTTVQAGTLAAGSAGAFVQNTAYTVNGGTLDLGTWDLATSNFSGTGGTVALNAQTLTANQATDSSYAGAITGTGGLVKAAGGTLTLAGASSFSGGTALKGGTLAVANNSALGTGGLSMDDGTTLAFAANNLTIANAITMTGTNDPTFDTGANTATLTGGISGAADLTKTGTGTLIFGAANNTYTGSTTVAQGTLRAGVANAFAPTSATTVASGATLATGGFNQTVGSLTNAGTVSLLGASAGSTLTVNGNYVGNNGLLQVGTVLGDSSSVTDKLVVTGTASGTTAVQVTNLNGLGGQTTGNGIQVVSAAGGIAGSAFNLATPVSAGAYDYQLNTVGGGAYLSSTTAPPPAPAPAPSPAPAPAAGVPTYRADVPLYAALPEQLRQSNLAMLGNLHQRTGDDGGTGSNSTSPDQGYRQAWGRVISIDRDISQSGTVSPTSSGRLTGFQAGTDLWANTNWRTGVYVGQLEGDMSVTGFARGVVNYAAGSNDLRSQYLGAYATWKNDTGLYVDGVLQAGRHRYTVNPTLAFSSSGKGDSLLASIEVGQAFAIAPNWTIEPQLQLVHQRLSLDDTSITGAWVHQNTDGGWMARAGVRIKGEFQTGLGTLQPYARLNVYKRSSGTDTTSFIGPAASTPILTRTGGTSSEVALGATWQLSQRTSLYGELGKLWASGGDARTKSGVNGSLGVKVRW